VKECKLYPTLPLIVLLSKGESLPIAASVRLKCISLIEFQKLGMSRKYILVSFGNKHHSSCITKNHQVTNRKISIKISVENKSFILFYVLAFLFISVMLLYL
jgi:hypothetical protein